MPRYNGTGPGGLGPGTGWGMGPCGAGMGWRRGFGRGFGRFWRFGSPITKKEEKREERRLPLAPLFWYHTIGLWVI